MKRSLLVVTAAVAVMVLIGLASPTFRQEVYGQTEIACFNHSGPKDMVCFGVPSVGDVLNVIWDPGEFAGPVTRVGVNSVTVFVLVNNGSPFKEQKETRPLSVGIAEDGLGGISVSGRLAGLPLETPGSSGPNAGVLAGVIAAAVAVGAVTLGGAAWYARRRWLP